MRNNLVWIIMDSCRYDSYERARTPNMDRIARAEKRYSYASWTSPSHYVMLMGLLPHRSPKQVFASEVYKVEYKKWVKRIGIDDLSFASFVPEMSLPKMLSDQGYRTIARVSLPVLNQYTAMSQYFDDYRLMDDHNDFAGMIVDIEFSGSQPSFYFLNLGETHYPYMLSPSSMKYVAGVHGTLKNLDRREESDSPDRSGSSDFFSKTEMARLHGQQVQCVEYVDELLAELYKKCPANTHFIITADHGELFGEGNYFGHGPIFHEKVFEVPFLEGMLAGY